jgi:N-acetylglucosaminyldiphosphoundecaprenol N-acetyl-beta-D-mannosaminyltransferase
LNAGNLEVLGVPVHAVTRAHLTDLLCQVLQSDARGWFSYVNVHAVNLAQQYPQFLSFLQTSLVNYCDGEGVRLGARILGTRLPERIVMTEWVEDVFRLAQERGFRIFLLGGSEEIVTRASRAMAVRYPQARISGHHHGFLTSEGSEHVVDTINRSGTDILIVGMGMPLQEEWIVEHFDRLNIRVALNAGSCFEYLAGAKRRCPRWMGEHGLEWLFRLIQEPGRLWKRYLLGNPLFLTRILRERVANRARSR